MRRAKTFRGAWLFMVVVAAVVVASGSPARSASRAVNRCAGLMDAERGRTGVSFQAGNVVVIRDLTGPGRRDGTLNVRFVSYRACWRPTGRTSLIFRSRPRNGHASLIGLRASGDWLVYSTVGSGPVASRTGVIQSIDVRDGLFGPIVQEKAGVVVGGDGPIPDLAAYTGQFAITASGYFAWAIALPAAAGKPPFSGLVAPLWDGRDYFVDTAMAITQLSAAGKSIRWRHDGQLKSLVLPDPIQSQQIE